MMAIKNAPAESFMDQPVYLLCPQSLPVCLCRSARVWEGGSNHFHGSLQPFAAGGAKRVNV